ncbi:MAG TPA: endo-1,4-beta-xylanase [Candidatus Saccharimonadales bacterium]|nr:endo-1,4-beta-xylanase [Candidatus Saccharimonadales bacterium]
MIHPEVPEVPENPYLSTRQFLKGAAILLAGTALEACTSGESDKPGEPIIPHVAMERREVVREADLLQAGPWQYMAGARVVPGGLELAPTGAAIVNKRQGNRIDPNPPLQVFGPRLQTEGDFSVNARIQSDTPVSLQLYGQTPLRFDDFRVERARLECTLSGNALDVRVWDGSKQEPAVVTGFPFGGSSANRQIEVRRERGKLLFTVNGREVGALPAKGNVFSSGEIWLGMNSEQGPAHVSRLTVKPLNGRKLEIVNTASLRITQQLPEGLQTLVPRPGFRLGAAAALNPLVSDPHYAQLFLGGELGSITTENALKPQDIQPTEGTFTFGETEALILLAERHSLTVHGHTLVYDKAMPKWMQELPFTTEADKQRVRRVLEQHIKTVVSHFKGRVASWDVVNEAIAGFNSDAHLQESIWFKALGEEYIDIAFRAAHEADPNAKLYINDYGLETNPQGRGEFMLALVKRMQGRGVPIHGIGIEGHVYEMPRDTIKPRTLRQFMDAAQGLGLSVRVSELDVTGKNGAKAQAEQYASVLKVCLAAPNCTGLTIWGMDDLHGSTAGIKGGQLRPGDALPYTADYRPKRARRAMRDILRAA